MQGDIDWFVLDDPENDSEDLYLNRAKNAKTLFNNDGLNPDNRHLVVRYILSQRMMKLDSSSSIYISEYDKDREGLLKTQMHKEDWDKVIRDLLAIPNDKIITEMGKACKDMTLPYGSANSEWKYWHNLICQNPDFYEKICDIKSGFTPRLSCIEKTLAVVMGGNASNGRIILNRSFLKTVHYVLEELKNKGFEFKDFISFEIDGNCITMFQYDHFSIRFTKKKSKAIVKPYYLNIYLDSTECKPVFCIFQNNSLEELDKGIKRRFRVDGFKEADKWIDAVDKFIN